MPLRKLINFTDGWDVILKSLQERGCVFPDRAILSATKSSYGRLRRNWENIRGTNLIPVDSLAASLTNSSIQFEDFYHQQTSSTTNQASWPEHFITAYEWSCKMYLASLLPHAHPLMLKATLAPPLRGKRGQASPDDLQQDGYRRYVYGHCLYHIETDKPEVAIGFLPLNLEQGKSSKAPSFIRDEMKTLEALNDPVDRKLIKPRTFVLGSSCQINNADFPQVTKAEFFGRLFSMYFSSLFANDWDTVREESNPFPFLLYSMPPFGNYNQKATQEQFDTIKNIIDPHTPIANCISYEKITSGDPIIADCSVTNNLHVRNNRPVDKIHKIPTKMPEIITVEIKDPALLGIGLSGDDQTNFCEATSEEQNQLSIEMKKAIDETFDDETSE